MVMFLIYFIYQLIRDVPQVDKLFDKLCLAVCKDGAGKVAPEGEEEGEQPPSSGIRSQAKSLTKICYTTLLLGFAALIWTVMDAGFYAKQGVLEMGIDGRGSRRELSVLSFIYRPTHLILLTLYYPSYTTHFTTLLLVPYTTHSL